MEDWLTKVDEAGCWGWAMAGAFARGVRLPEQYMLTAAPPELRDRILFLARRAAAARQAGDNEVFKRLRGDIVGLIEGDLFDAAASAYREDLLSQGEKTKAMLFERRFRGEHLVR